MGLTHPCLMLIAEPRRGLDVVVAEAVGQGVNAVLWRDARTTIGKRDPALTGVVAVTNERALLIAEGNWETLVRLGLRRIHLPEHSAPVGVVKFRIGNGALVGRSVGSVGAAVQAAADGADYVLVEGIFGPEHEADADGGRMDLLRGICAAVRISVIAAGGITPGNIADCIDAGAAGVAVASATQVPDPHGAETYRTALDAAWAGRRDDVSA